jgi:site-specific recombinase XerC
MASIYKRPADKGKKNKPWLIEYVDHEGKRAYAKGFTDKALTEQLAAKLENEVLLRKRGMIDPAQERLLAIKQSPITEALAAFERSLDANTPKHIRLTMTRVRALIDASGAKTIGELDAEHVENALKVIRSTKDLGKRTYNHYLQAIDEFGKWLVSSKRLPTNPVAGIERLNAETDVRHQRRALTTDEVSRLVRAARESGVEVQGYSGELRARVYLMSFLTGLRRLELASLTPQSFKLDDAQPTLVVQASSSKHRRKDTLPMHPDLVAMVREWTTGMEPDAPLFPGIGWKKTYTMVQKDLERAGIPYKTHEGLADFHAAGRHSHITGLVRSGASIMEAKELARHADIRQTAKYTHIGMEDRAEALGNLPTPKTYASAELSEIRRVSGGVLGQEVSAAGTEGGENGLPVNDETPSGEGVSSSLGVASQELAVDASYGGGGNCTRVPRPIDEGIYVRIRFFDCRPGRPNRRGRLWLIPS